MDTILPLVSVLMTAYNRDKYIAEAIESVLNSTYTNFELIIVDDCSTDETFAIASSYLGKDERIKVFKNEYNLGQFANRNKAIEIAKGEYIKFLDSDDKIMPDGLQVMVTSMLAFPDAGIGVPAKATYKKKLPYKVMPHESVWMHYTTENHLCYGPTGSIFKKVALQEAGLFEEEYGILADTLLNIKMASFSPTVFFESGLFYWRRHNEQVTEAQNDDVRMIGERDLILKAAMAYRQLPLNQIERKQILKNFIKINTRHFLRYFLKGKFKMAFQIKRETELSFTKVLSVLFKK